MGGTFGRHALVRLGIEAVIGAVSPRRYRSRRST